MNTENTPSISHEVATPAAKPARKRAPAPTIRATLDKANTKKEARQENTPKCSEYILLARDKSGEYVHALNVRCYFNPRGTGMQPVRASLWSRPFDGGNWRTGRGDAGGCGYHKESAAIAEAFDNAGFKFWGDPYARTYRGEKPDFKRRVHFGGTGASEYAEIFRAAARALGYKGKMIFVSA